MRYTFSQSPKAEREIITAWKWYEDELEGLGDRFRNEVFKKIDVILQNPFHYPLKGIHREAKIKVFPFLIVYHIDEQSQQILIVSIFHTSRHPKRKYHL